MRPIRAGFAAVVALFAAGAYAQLPFVPAANPSGVNQAVPTQNPFGPTGVAWQQSNYPYPGQCLADATNTALFPLLSACAPNTGSFACNGGTAPQTAGGWMACGAAAAPKFVPLNPLVADSTVAATFPTPKYVWPVLNPPDYLPDTGRYPGADYYEIGVHEAWGVQAVASAGLFPNPPAGLPIPDGMQWTGLVCNIPAGCTCPNGVTNAFKATYCTGTGNTIPAGNPLFTPIWGVGQINNGGGPVTQVLQNWLGTCSTSGALCWAAGPLNTLPACPATETCNALGLFQPAATAAPWSANNYIATWPSISIRGTAGTPVVVKWVNEFPDNHLFCPHPEAADWPCAIDRTFMGVKAAIDPALGNGTVPTHHVNQWGSPQQPDNSWVTHLHGGEIPPSTDGFAELWYGNATTAVAYDNMAKNFVTPPFENPSGILLKRPVGNAAVYTYPMVNEESTIWFHDHTLGKTHHNVIAGPAGFFPVKEPQKHGPLTAWNPYGAVIPGSEYTWLDPVTEPRNFLGQPKYDLFLAIQDRAFNDDGSINFSNGLGQVLPPAGGGVPSPVTPGVVPEVHPVWAPEYFGDHALVNGVLWPRYAAEPGWYRLRLVDGSDSRCWTIGFQASATPIASGAKPVPNVPFHILASDQGYLPKPISIYAKKFTMCPGERYEVLINFAGYNGQSIYMTNEAAAPYPAGDLPYDTVDALGTPVPAVFPEVNTVMRFDVSSANGPGVQNCASTVTWNPAWSQAQMAANIASKVACMPRLPHNMQTFNASYSTLARPALPVAPATWAPGTVVRQVFLNERIDGFTGAPTGMQLNGVPFEYKVTETPRENSTEVWQFINLTVDAHPMHPHLVRHLVIGRQWFNSGGYRTALCGSSTCSPGPAPGLEMGSIPDVTPFLMGAPGNVTAYHQDSGWKDASQAPPSKVTTIIAKWEARWPQASTPAAATAPGTAGCPDGTGCIGSSAASWLYEPVTSGPYVWHCHINSHEDSEMMRSSLVVK